MDKFRSLHLYMLKMRLFNAFRATFIFILIIVFATFFQLPLTLFAIYPALFLMFYSKDESYTAGISLICGVVLSALLMSICIHFFSQQPYLFLLFSVIVSFAQAYWVAETMRNRWPYQITAIFSIIVTVTIAFTASSASETTEILVIQWFMQFVIGLVILSFITQLVWPLPKSKDVLKVYHGIIEEYIFLLKSSSDSFIKKEKFDRIDLNISLNELYNIEKLIKTRKTPLSNDTPHFQVLLVQLDALLHLFVTFRLIESVLIQVNDKDIDTDSRRYIECEIMSLIRRLDILVLYFSGHESSQSIIDYFQNEIVSKKYNSHILSGIYVHIYTANKSISALMNSFNNLNTKDIEIMKSKNIIKSGLKRDYNTLHLDSAKSAIKMMLALTIALLIHIALPNVPASDYLVICIVVMLAQVNLGGIHLRLPLWIFGIISGVIYSSVGILVIDAQDHLILLIVWMATGFLFGTYLAAGSAKIAYAGVQFCIGMTMTFGSQAFPLSSSDEILGKLTGALIGFSISFLVAHFLWPEHPRQQFRRSSANILDEAKYLLLTLINVNNKNMIKLNDQFYQVSHSLQSNFILINDYSYTFHKSNMIEEYMHEINLSCSRLSLQLITAYDVFNRFDSFQEKKYYIKLFVKYEKELSSVMGSVSEVVFDINKRVREHVVDLQLVINVLLSNIETSSSMMLNDIKEEHHHSKVYYGGFVLLGVVSELSIIIDTILKTIDYDEFGEVVDKVQSTKYNCLT
ncbi:hypothetical protein [uncultured Shewanella sp.]|uniref:hypothetical protein n=1 Tax=uncultured Shewanella sp. TaxID=173975 RepID=UPI002622B568|nr:hypothetical protein [uncultured Shewanella sp.]